jgi:hypothetical protein
MGHSRCPATLAPLVVAALLLSAAFAPSAHAAFGFESLVVNFTEEDGSPATQAGSHPYALTMGFSLKTVGTGSEELPDGALKDLRIQLPAGLVGTPGLLPQCSRSDYLMQSCPAASAVGAIFLHTDSPETEGESFPLYNLDPLPGNAAELAFTVAEQVSVIVELQVATAPPYNLIASITNAPRVAAFFGSTLTIRGVSGGEPFLTLPRSCAPAATTFEADPWESPGAWVSSIAPEPLTPTSCGNLDFHPALSVRPTTSAAGAPSGLDLGLDLPDEGLTSPTGTAAADLAAATVDLPAGMTINPALAAGLGVCTPAQLAAETPTSEPGAGCPQSAKVGTAEATTPLLDEPVAGTLFVAQPDDPATMAPGAENPLDARFVLYLVLRDAGRGVLVSVPMAVEPDPATGRLTTRLEALPQLPFTHLELHFSSGARAPLATPPGCGAHAISYSLAPSSGNPPVEGRDAFATSAGCGSAFAPSLSAGTMSARAGTETPFVLELRNGAGDPNLSRLRLTLPPGLAAALTAAATCPEPATATAVCPADSRLGYARLALGPGPEPLWVPSGSEPDSAIFLAGPYRGAPFSLLVSVPAAAGPFDLGRVVLRAPALIDPNSGRVSVEMDNLPQILDGVPLHYRAIRLVLDRPGFIRNPTSCRPMRIELAATAADGGTATAADRFQADDCSALGFRPRLAVRLSGNLARNSHPRVEARVASKRGQANLSAATFDLLAGELLDTRHIRALCARNMPIGHCPESSRLGQVSLRSPLLPETLRGPIFLRAPSRSYPDLVAEVRAGDLRLNLHGTTASARGGRLRIRLSGLPDLPLSQAAVTLRGGRRGIVVNSSSLCGRPLRGSAVLRAQNGKVRRLQPRLRLDGRC